MTAEQQNSEAQSQNQSSVTASENVWLTPQEAWRPLKYKAVDGLYRDIREGLFPFRFERKGKRILICARSSGLIPTP